PEASREAELVGPADGGAAERSLLAEKHAPPCVAQPLRRLDAGVALLAAGRGQLDRQAHLRGLRQRVADGGALWHPSLARAQRRRRLRDREPLRLDRQRRDRRRCPVRWRRRRTAAASAASARGDIAGVQSLVRRAPEQLNRAWDPQRRRDARAVVE